MKKKPLALSTNRISKTVLSLLVVLFTVNCTPSQISEPQIKHIDETAIAVEFGSSLDEGNVLRAQYNMFESGDRIGLFATKADVAFSAANIYENANNLPYMTRETAGNFYGDGASIYYPMDGTSLHFVAYYPYNAELKLAEGATSLIYPIDVEQQKLMLYSDNLTLSRNDDQANAVLRFRSPFARIELHVKAQDNSDISDLSAYITGAKKSASFDLIKGELKVNEDNTIEKLNLNIAGADNNRVITAYLLPTEATDNVVVHLVLGDKRYQLKLDQPLQSQHRYVREVTLTTSGNVTIERAYGNLEEAVYTTAEEAPNSQLVKHMVGNASWLTDKPGIEPNTIRNYTIMYDTKHHLPYWVAYPLHKQYLGSAKRTNAWGFDSILANNVQPDLTRRSYAGSYDRGHLMPSADRTASTDINRTTFYCSNMCAQQDSFNQGPWAELENKVRSWLNTSSDQDTIFVVVGCLWPKNENEMEWIADGGGNAKGAVKPTHMYKILLKYTGYDNKYQVAAYNMPNISYSNNGAYRDYIVSIKELEELSGFTFFPALEKRISKAEVEALKSAKNGI